MRFIFHLAMYIIRYAIVEELASFGAEVILVHETKKTWTNAYSNGKIKASQ